MSLAHLKETRGVIFLQGEASTSSFSLCSYVKTSSYDDAFNQSGLWLSDYLLRFALSSSGPTGDGSHSGITSNAGIDPSKIATRYLVSDAMDWLSTANQFHNCLSFETHNPSLPARIYCQLQYPDSGISWSSSLKRFIPRNASAYLVPPTSNSPNTKSNFAATGSEWVPSCDHWVLRVNSFKVLSIRRISNNLFRLYVQPQRRKKKLGYLKVTRSGKIPVPYAILSNYLSPDLWEFFWSLSLPHKVSESETIQHLFVSCFYKWSFWESQLAALQLTAKFPTPESVWLSIYSLHDETGELIDEAVLLSLGIVLEIVWHHHWMWILTTRLGPTF
ncbi:hypothetical protein BD770DRAFT_465235 [Pilaira anomala]|nr:hypothetical protein BD770DRAFT_465235 [Pilaira anomala]